MAGWLSSDGSGVVPPAPRREDILTAAGRAAPELTYMTGIGFVSYAGERRRAFISLVML